MMMLLLVLLTAALLAISDSAVSTNASHPYAQTIPLLSVSLHEDQTDYLPRLLRSIDYDVNRIVIQIGNEDTTVLETIIRKVLYVSRDMPHLSISISVKNVNPGCANGFNLGLRGLVGDLNSTSTAPPLLQSMAKDESTTVAKSNTHVSSSPDDWVLIVNSDIAFYPGTLQKIAVSVEQQLHDDPLFGVGLFDVGWSAFMVTRRLINRIGYFDENIYPAYYEDNDYGIRVALSGMHAARFDNAPILHGDSRLTGTESRLLNVKFRALFDVSLPRTREYMTAKWGRPHCWPIDCKFVNGMNAHHHDHDKPVPFKHPFGDPSKPLWHWQLDQPRRDAILQKALGAERNMHNH